jgi:hypothetical protein
MKKMMAHKRTLIVVAAAMMLLLVDAAIKTALFSVHPFRYCHH